MFDCLLAFVEQMSRPLDPGGKNIIPPSFKLTVGGYNFLQGGPPGLLPVMPLTMIFIFIHGMQQSY